MTSDSPVTQLSELPITPVNPDSPIPLYHQIEEELRRLINSGQIPPQATLPSELKLCQAYGVGRHTMRVALSRLVTDNLISRRAGRGTFVKPQPDRMKFYLDRSFTQQMADMGRAARSSVLKMAVGQIEPICPDVFEEKIGADYLQLVRLRFGDDEPIALQSSIILTELCPGLDRYDFDHNGLYDVLAGEYQLSINEIHHTITAEVADGTQADLLEIVEGDPLLVVKTSAFLDNEQVVEHTISYYRSDRYEYRTRDRYTP